MLRRTQTYTMNKKGFALLYAVFISSMVLAIALGVSSIAYKEIIFGTSAKDANDAFYAADTAAECTLYYDNTDMVKNAFVGSVPVTMYCNGNQINIASMVSPAPGYDLGFVFTVSQLGLSGKACASVEVDKKTDDAKTKIISVGYNNGGETAGICSPNATSVQRVLELNY